MDITQASGAWGRGSVPLGGTRGPGRKARKCLLSQQCLSTFNRLDPTLPGQGVWAAGGVMELPKCQKCNNGTLIPLSDYGQEGASVIFKAWACTNPECGFSLRIDKGEVTYGKKIEHKRSESEGMRSLAREQRLLAH